MQRVNNRIIIKEIESKFEIPKIDITFQKYKYLALAFIPCDRRYFYLPVRRRRITGDPWSFCV